MPRPLAAACSAALAALALVACGGDGGDGTGGGSAAGASATPTPRASSLFGATRPTCPAATSAPLSWPAGVPAELPTPPGATLTDVQERTDGLTVVTFSTASGLRDGVLFLVEELPRAGFTLARGDAENTEADVPFVKGGLRGVLRMIAVEPCRTDWLMAISKGGPAGAPGTGTPLLPARPDASPLPFG